MAFSSSRTESAKYVSLFQWTTSNDDDIYNYSKNTHDTLGIVLGFFHQETSVETVKMIYNYRNNNSYWYISICTCSALEIFIHSDNCLNLPPESNTKKIQWLRLME